MAESQLIQIPPNSRGIVDHFFCFICDSYVWDCHHLIEERLNADKVDAPQQLLQYRVLL